MTAGKELSDYNPDGTSLGQSTTDLVGFHGTAPTAKASVTTVATGATIATVVARLQQLTAALKAKGLIA
jgi:hypothetical protein